MVSWLWKKGDKKEQQEVDEDELKKKGFNPEGLDVEELQDQQLLNNFEKDYEGFITPTPEETQQIITAFKCFFPYVDTSPTTRNIVTNTPITKVAKFAQTKFKSTRFDQSAKR